ncbi:DEP domain-containing protein 7-like [Brachionichthys hirsutus]|uniref:DEP domain-containing protein 7-like n=1 Tax=Brachionichthys hirsutus TaxID=412623 RepID=UPI003604342C
MASIKERAAALNLAEKLCVRPQAHGAASKPVQSSCIWSGLISHLKSSVTVKRRRVHLKSHNDCFLGSEAVDVVAEHLGGAKGFEGVAVSRDKVGCVCQALLDCNVFEAVGTKVFGKDVKHSTFQDSKSALYRFVSVRSPSVDDLERGALVNGIQKLFCGSPSDGQEQQTCPNVQTSSSPVMLTPQTAGKVNHLDLPLAAGASSAPVTDSLSPSRALADTVLPQSLVDEVWQEQTLLRLLNLVELPLLEGLLQCTQTPSSSPRLSHSNPDLIYSSNHLDRRILKAFRDSQEDEWLCAGLDCLDFLPDQPVVELSRELPHCFPDHQPPGSSLQDGGEWLEDDDPPCLSQSGLDQCKLLLFRTLVKHYHADRPPLMPQHMADIYTAITDLLVNAKLSTALQALQLCLKLLPAACRDELHRLLSFMALAADPNGIKLDKEVENRLAVKRFFSRAVLHKTISKDMEDLMVAFMLSNIKDIFRIPGALHKGVSDKLASLAQEKPPDATGSAFSEHVSDSTKNTTNQELWVLLNNIYLDTKRSSRERKRLLRQFYGAHPEIFDQYFGESALGVL